jgi:hypothetical protein
MKRIRAHSIPRVRVQRVRAQQPTIGLTLLDAIADPELFKPFFRDHETWATWFAIIAAIFALPMTAEQLRLYRLVTGRQMPPAGVAREIWLVVGRRGGKSRLLALISVWLACFYDYSDYLSPGEKGTVQVIASDRRQARTIIRYVKSFLTGIPMLAKMIEGETQESVSLDNNVVIEVHTASFRSVRGFTLVAALLDELAFFQSDDSANPDTEILAAIKPGMATIPNALLLCASSPYAKRGALYQAWKDHYGKEGDPIIVVQAATDIVNPKIDPQVIADAYAADPASASAEYGACFREDLAEWIAREAVEACVSDGIFERPYVSDQKYIAFCDPAGGSGKDSFTLAIAHRENGMAVLDVIRERKPPFSPEGAIEEYALVLKAYGISKVIGDRFGGEFPRELFRKHHIDYEPSAKPKSDLYRDCLPLLNSKKADLLDNTKLVNQFIGLERRTARSGKDSIDHMPGAHDDLANAAAGALCNLSVRAYKYDSSLNWVGGDDLPSEREDYRASRIRNYVLNGGLIR